MILKKKRISFLISLTQSQPIKERHITESWTIEYIIRWIKEMQDMILKKETYFIFDLTDSIAAYHREAHYRVMDF